MSKNNGKYKVGYGKPPKKTRFKKGESGNPGGRPKKIKIRKNLYTVFKEELDKKTIVINGRKTTIKRALTKKLIKDAFDDPKGPRKIFELLKESEGWLNW